MTERFRPIDAVALLGTLPPETLRDPGPKPVLAWLPIAKLVIDGNYQRDIVRRGARNVGHIAREFDWAKFGVIVVALVEGETDLYAIVDGQHRTTAAAIRAASAAGFDEVPCLIVQADAVKQAAVFAAINGNVTAMTSLQIHHAKLASGDPDAVALSAACAEAGVTICRHQIPASNMKAGETLAIATVRKMMELHGRRTMVTALRAIMKTAGGGKPGVLRSQVIEAMCAVLAMEPRYAAAEPRLFKVMETFDVTRQFDKASIRARQEKRKVSAVLVAALAAHIDGQFARAA